MPHRWSLVALHALLDRGLDNPVRDANTLCYDLLMHWPSLWTFVTTPGVEPTNNGAERALRPAVLWRKGSFGSDSIAGEPVWGAAPHGSGDLSAASTTAVGLPGSRERGRPAERPAAVSSPGIRALLPEWG